MALFDGLRLPEGYRCGARAGHKWLDGVFCRVFVRGFAMDAGLVVFSGFALREGSGLLELSRGK